MIAGLLTDHWDAVHPRMIIDDEEDPDYRTNALAQLSGAAVITGLANAPLVSSRAVGKFSLRDYRIASGEISLTAGSTETAPEMGHIAAAFMDVEIDEIQTAAAATEEIITNIASIEALVDEKITTGQVLDWLLLKKELGDIKNIYAEQLTRRGVGVPGAEENADAEGGGAAPQAPVVSGAIGSREDVVRQIEKICEYYQNNEPSSPVPLILNRAKRLVTMDFMSIMRDISPESVKQLESLGGLEGQ